MYTSNDRRNNHWYLGQEVRRLMITRIDPPLPVETPKGKGLAHFLIDYGIENNFYWIVFINETGECWTYPNPLIRMEKNITLGRTATDFKKINEKSH